MSILKGISIVGLALVIALLGFGSYLMYDNNQKIEQKRSQTAIYAKALADAKVDAAEQKRLEAEQAQAEAKNKVYQSNKESLGHKGLALEAQLALTDDQDRLIRELIEESFTNYNDIAVAKAGSMIHRIGGESAVKIVASYRNDPQVVVRKNVEWWYKQYSPGAMDDRIEKLEVKHHITAVEAPPTAPKVEIDTNVKKFTPAVKTVTRPTVTPKATKKSLSADDQEKNARLEDRINWIKIQIQDTEYSLSTMELCLNDSPNPNVKMSRRRSIQEYKDRIAGYKKELSKLE